MISKLCILAVAAAMSLPCRAADTNRVAKLKQNAAARKEQQAKRAEPDAMAIAVARRVETVKIPKIAKSEVRNNMVVTTFADGTTKSEPVKRAFQPASVAGAVDVLLAVKRLEKVAYAAAKIAPDAPPAARVAVLDALAAQAGKSSIAKLLAAAAVGAIAAAAATRKKGLTP